jgi:hypothetical protein
MQKTENKAFLPFVVATMLAMLILLSSFNSGVWENQKIVIISLIIWFIWFFFFIVEKVKGTEIGKTKWQFFAKLFFVVIISFFFANRIWSEGYLTLDTINAIIDGNIHCDTLFHSTLAESIKNYGYPSILMKEASFFNYHFGSHIIIAVLSIILNIAVFNVYNYLYPIICIPIYSYLLISVIIEIRKYKNEEPLLSVIDYVFLSFFVIGFLPSELLHLIGIWKRSWIVSESFFFALIFFLLYILLMFKAVRNNWSGKLFFLLTLLFIVICSSMKISVGFLFAVGVIYINFRKNIRKISYWIFGGILFIIFIICFGIFTWADGGGTKFELFSFVSNYTSFGKIGWVYHYFFIVFFTLLFLLYQLSVNIPLKNAILSNKLIIEETLVVVSLVSLLPSLLLNIVGGSAAYFSYFQELIAVSLLLGYNIPGKIQQRIVSKNIIVKCGIGFCVFILILTVCANSSHIKIFLNTIKIKTPTENSLLSNLRSINTIPRKEKSMYGIFLDRNAEIWDNLGVYDSYNYYLGYTNLYANYLYSGLTGILMLNGLDRMLPLTFEEAKEEAKKINLKYLIYFFGDTYQIIEI